MLGTVFIVGWIVVYFFSVIALILLWGILDPSGDTAPPAWVVLSYLIGGPLGCVVALALSVLLPFHAWRSRKHLRRELRRRGIPICITCGYEGGDINAPRCPECGAPTGA